MTVDVNEKAGNDYNLTNIQYSKTKHITEFEQMK